MVNFYKKDDFKKKVLESLETAPLRHIFMKNIINDAGQTVFVLPSIDTSNPEENEKIMDMHIHNTMLEYERITGTMFLKFAVRYINENFDIENVQDDNELTELQVVQDEMKTMPFGDIWDEYCIQCGVKVDREWFEDVKEYENKVLNKR